MNIMGNGGLVIILAVFVLGFILAKMDSKVDKVLGFFGAVLILAFLAGVMG